MPKTDVITQARLKELLHYDPETGLFTRLTSPSNRIKIGDVAGSPDKDGYVVITVDYIIYKAHRLAFLYMLGWMPEQVDHDDHIRNNNRWANLNPSTNTGNQRNRSLNKNNTSGTCGVVWCKAKKKWKASIRVDSKRIHLGYFTGKPSAIAARKAADTQYEFHANHGSIKL